MAHQTVIPSPDNARSTVQPQKKTDTQGKAILKVPDVGRHSGLLNKMHDLYRLSYRPDSEINVCVLIK